MTSGFQFGTFFRDLRFREEIRKWLIRSSNLVWYHMGESHDISGDSQENKCSDEVSSLVPYVMVFFVAF